jgi:predicted Rossmann-fold nucleotide-binding protein
MKSVAVFCAAANGSKPGYRAAAEALGRTLAQHNLGLIYGGGRTGLMGATMHTRKAMMAERADAFFILPGGFGTLEEMFEVLAWQTLKIHAKPVVLLNIAGFFDALLGFLDVCDREGMLRGNRGILLVAKTPEEALKLVGLL